MFSGAHSRALAPWGAVLGFPSVLGLPANARRCYNFKYPVSLHTAQREAQVSGEKQAGHLDALTGGPASSDGLPGNAARVG